MMIEEIKKAVEILHSGGIILYPTDTIWGIGCDATNAEAVKRVYEIKRRADSKSMLVLLDSPAKLSYYVEEVPDVAWDLIELSEKPLTIIYPNARNLAKNIISDDGSIGIRISREVFSKTLCQRFRKPIVSTSANITGKASPINFVDIQDEIKDKMDYIVNYRQTEFVNTKPSSIIKLDAGNVFKIIRE